MTQLLHLPVRSSSACGNPPLPGTMSHPAESACTQRPGHNRHRCPRAQALTDGIARLVSSQGYHPNSGYLLPAFNLLPLYLKAQLNNLLHSTCEHVKAFAGGERKSIIFTCARQSRGLTRPLDPLLPQHLQQQRLRLPL